jgi:sigma-B regulation protein RsbU (phosphoserine phosphatase)
MIPYLNRLVRKLMQIRAPLFVKIMAPLILLITLTVGISGYRVYQESTGRWQTEMDTRLARVASLVAAEVDRERLSSIHEPIDIDSPAYQQIADRLEQAVIAANVAWVGIYYREGDYFYYWVDYDYTGVGYPFFYATAAHFAAYADRQPHPVEYTDEFGSYYGFVAPIIVTNEAGEEEVIGLVEALVDQAGRTLLQQNTLNRVLPILLAGSFIAVIFSALITVALFNQPLHRLQQGALALSQGQFGYLIDLSSRDELGDLADSFNQMSRQLKQLYHKLAERERIERELEIAQRVQLAIFPAEIPQIAGLDIATFCRPHRETSGDFYDLFPFSNDQMGIVVGDVSGKSIPAAMVMVAAQSILRAEAYNHTSPAQVLDKSNTILAHRIIPGMFAAVSYARLDVGKREIVWANAGNVYPFLLYRVPPLDLTDYPHYLETRGLSLPLGINDDIHYEADSLALSPGDMILFYTDGIVEAMNDDRQIYGFERLETLFRSLPPNFSSQDLLEAVLADIVAFVGGAEQHDDMTMVAVKLIDEEAATSDA